MNLVYMPLRTFIRALDVLRLRCFPLSGIVRISPLLVVSVIPCCEVAAQTPTSSSGTVEGAAFTLDSVTVSRLPGAQVELKGSKIFQTESDPTGTYALRKPSLLLWLESALTNANCSLSDRLRLMGQSRAFRGFDIGDRFWQDIDTPAALDYAFEAGCARPRPIRAGEGPAHV
jgi:hypothetical protein